MTKFSPKGMSEEEMRKLWQQLTIKFRMVAKACYYLQLRPSEACQIRLSDIKKDFITIRHQKNKMRNEVYPIPYEFMQDLVAYCHLFREDILAHDGFLFFSNSKSVHVSYDNLHQRMMTARTRLGWDDSSVYMIDKSGRKRRRISMHTHKAEAVRRTMRKTGNLIATQGLAHHKSFTTTLRYIGDPTQDIELKKEGSKKAWEES